MISAAFMLQVRSWLFKVFGSFVVASCFILCFILIYLLTVVYGLRIHSSLSKLCAVSAVFVVGYLLIMRQEYFSEKTHVLTYGLLGYLAANDLTDSKRRLQLKNVALSVIFVSFISGLDEIFQGILPYRFAELKDFITNIFSGVLGIVIRKIFLYNT